jgi:hypothetical protein
MKIEITVERNQIGTQVVTKAAHRDSANAVTFTQQRRKTFEMEPNVEL